MAEEAGDAFDKLKGGAKAVAKKVTDPNRDLGTEYEKEKIKEGAGDYERDVSGTNDPMSPEKIATHEPTAVKRDKNKPLAGNQFTPFLFNSNTKWKIFSKAIFVIIVAHHLIRG